jgi:rhodanese-related sulfurtransferase
MTAFGYAGDISSPEAWDILAKDSRAALVDVRTDAEWSFVGMPDLQALGRPVICVSWQTYPEMAVNTDFAADLEARGVTPDRPVLLLCRSGQRSRIAAQALTRLGYRSCYNIADGFEGPPDEERHRGRVTGWKASGLPWIQG